MTTLEISQMTQAEKLQTMEALWDSLIHETPEIQSPEWHQDVLAARKKSIEEGTAEFISIEELRSSGKR
jgi:putative addiction module component (TIGR02574 family)